MDLFLCTASASLSSSLPLTARWTQEKRHLNQSQLLYVSHLKIYASWAQLTVSYSSMAFNDFGARSFLLNKGGCFCSLAKRGWWQRNTVGRKAILSIPMDNWTPHRPHLHFLKAGPCDLLRHWQGSVHLQRWRSSCLPALVKQCHWMFHCWVPISCSSAWGKRRINALAALSSTAPSLQPQPKARWCYFGVSCLHARWAEGPGDILQLRSLLLLPILSSLHHSSSLW